MFNVTKNISIRLSENEFTQLHTLVNTKFSSKTFASARDLFNTMVNELLQAKEPVNMDEYKSNIELLQHEKSELQQEIQALKQRIEIVNSRNTMILAQAKKHKQESKSGNTHVNTSVHKAHNTTTADQVERTKPVNTEFAEMKKKSSISFLFFD